MVGSALVEWMIQCKRKQQGGRKNDQQTGGKYTRVPQAALAYAGAAGGGAWRYNRGCI